MRTLTALIDRHGVDVHDHLDRAEIVPIHGGLQFQGDVAIVPTGGTSGGGSPIPAAGIPVVRGENGGNTHLLLAEGPCLWADGAGPTDLDMGTLTVPDGATAWMAHPEHGYLGIAPGVYLLRRQREQREMIALVQD